MARDPETQALSAKAEHILVGHLKSLARREGATAEKIRLLEAVRAECNAQLRTLRRQA